MADIQVIVRSENISYDELYEIISRSHEENRRNGLKINTKLTCGEDLKKHLGWDAVTYIALADGNPAGTVSVKMERGKQKYLRGSRTARLMHLAVLPEYKGCGIGSVLCGEVMKYADLHDAGAIVLNVVHNNPAAAFYEHIGFEPLDVIPRAGLKQNSLLMVRWMKECKVPQWRRKLHFKIRKAAVRAKYRFD